MPVSTSAHITHCLREIITLEPKSVLDVGMGFGLWGFLCREYLDVYNGRVQPEEWQARIDGIEFFEPYIQTHQRALYSSITIGDIRDLAPNLDEYELIIAGDVIEHLEKEDGEMVLDTLYEKATRALLINIPLGGGWDHPEQHGNPGELHRSEWTMEDLAPYPARGHRYEMPCGDYGSFFCSKDCGAMERAAGLVAAAEHYEKLGDLPRVLKYLWKAFAFEPGHPPVVMMLVDALIRSQDIDQALSVLDQALEAEPRFHRAHLYSAKLLAAQGRRQEAAARIGRLLEMDELAGDIRTEANELHGKLTLAHG